mmetsp:Transcript_120359/g.340558  ORF Transcript_120359/g.340558 Transcript_120359/m.340558 type:complete len:216 (+) Transcript_120359:618-1265(+)
MTAASLPPSRHRSARSVAAPHACFPTPTTHWQPSPRPSTPDNFKFSMSTRRRRASPSSQHDFDVKARDPSFAHSRSTRTLPPRVRPRKAIAARMPSESDPRPAPNSTNQAPSCNNPASSARETSAATCAEAAVRRKYAFDDADSSPCPFWATGSEPTRPLDNLPVSRVTAASRRGLRRASKASASSWHCALLAKSSPIKLSKEPPSCAPLLMPSS